MLTSGVGIWKAADVRHALATDEGVVVTNREVQRVLRQTMGLKYKAVKRIAFHGNSERNLVLR